MTIAMTTTVAPPIPATAAFAQTWPPPLPTLHAMTAIYAPRAMSVLLTPITAINSPSAKARPLLAPELINAAPAILPRAFVLCLFPIAPQPHAMTTTAAPSATCAPTVYAKALMPAVAAPHAKAVCA